ncbi:MAG: GTPase ObgE [Longimicrobiales bacterium]
MFVDYAIIDIEAGVGGSGAEAFLREMGVPFGGPAGGDGGHGGSVILRADNQLSTLLDFRYQQHYRAERGQHGQGKNRTGKDGEDMVLRVPIGTVVRDEATGEQLAELTENGEEFIAAKGGRGGRGNGKFATSTNQSPRRWEPGAEGEKRKVTLELKLIADVGLVGSPNAGKSTLLASVSAATPKIADYPFTTLTPNLGVVSLSEMRQFVIADIPGIIEGASEGKGLGLRFLRHIERTRTLAFLLSVEAEDLQAEYEMLRAELQAHSAELADKPHCVIITKMDIMPPDAEVPTVVAPDAWGQFAISAASRRGVDGLLEALWQRVRKTIAAETAFDIGMDVYQP